MRGIDHFFATSARPESLYRFFRDSLGWPEVFPFRDYGDFASGVVSVGNTMFEVVTWAVPPGQRLPTELKGLAFEPSERLPITLARLTEVLGSHQKPDSVMMTTDAGVRRLAYINIGLDGPGGLPPSTASIFINDNLGSVNAEKRKADGATELRRRNGGGLGILAIEELLIGVDDPARALSRWRPLGATTDERLATLTWPIGPRMRFVRSSREAILEMIVKVESLERASSFLATHRILDRTGGNTCIAASAVDGLRICLIE